MDNNLLVVAEKLDVTVVFSDKGMAKLLDEIKTKVIAHVSDTSSEQGRKDIISLAYKITRSKTLIDDLGKGVVADWKKKAKLIDEHRKTARDFLDDLKNTARQPLTDWEAEQAVIKAKEDAAAKEKIQKRIDTLFALNVIMPFSDVATLDDNSYEKLLAEKTEAYKIEQARIEEERKKKEIEAERLEQLAEEQRIESDRLAKIQTDQEKREKEITAKEKAIEDQKRAAIALEERKIWEERESERLRMQAEKIAIETVERKKQEEIARLVTEKAEQKRQSELLPDKEKLYAFARSIEARIIPDVKSEDAKKIVDLALKDLQRIATTIIKKADYL